MSHPDGTLKAGNADTGTVTTTMRTLTDAQTRALTLATGLTPRAETAIRRVSTFTVIVLAGAAAVLSYAGLTQLAVEAQINHHLTFLFPVVVDGLTLVGGMQVLHSTLTGVRSWYGWLLTLLGVGASVIGNIAASPVDPMARAVHAAPPIVLALALEALLRVYRHRVTQSHREQIHAMELLATQDADRAAADERADAAAAIRRADADTARVARDAEADRVLCEAEATRVRLDAEAARSWAPALTEPEPFAASAPTEAVPVTYQPAPVTPVVPVVAEVPAVATVPAIPSSSSDFDVTDLGVAADAPVRERISAVLSSDPELTGGQIARMLGVDRSYTNKVIRELQAESPTITVITAPPARPAQAAAVITPEAPAPAPVAVVEAAAPVVDVMPAQVAAPAPTQDALPVMNLPMFADELFDDVSARERQPEPV
jgi:Protein of unknown function (DUF2637)